MGLGSAGLCTVGRKAIGVIQKDLGSSRTRLHRRRRGGYGASGPWLAVEWAFHQLLYVRAASQQRDFQLARAAKSDLGQSWVWLSHTSGTRPKDSE